ncbi:hypothetical protein NQ317_004093 [Molorchus minor]|uniref:Uncharacterized protein n=1 Tax=Molorchus minor TaxID=1323400 RepID=A0ABQ9JUM7_9CUCU|nr:hypothetical protein NQ317_004093 [Molorchus minor]
MKSQGTNKINALCPAVMAVKIKDSGYVSVRYTKTHMGHKNDLGHVTLSQSERNAIALKISSNVPFDSILDEVRESLTADGELKRMHLLRKMDLHNIENSFKLNINVKKHENNATSVNMWVNELQNNDSCVLFYKPQQQIMEKYTQLKSDDFLCIKQKSWVLLKKDCAWHVDRAWRKNLSKIGEKDKQIKIYKMLRTLLQETDRNPFESMIRSAISQLLGDSATKSFGVYFQKEYLKSVES